MDFQKVTAYSIDHLFHNVAVAEETATYYIFITNNKWPLQTQN